MKQIHVTGKVVNREISFEKVRLGQTFIMIDPPDHYRNRRNMVFIKMGKSRIQELGDDNKRFTFNHILTRCAIVFIMAAVSEAEPEQVVLQQPTDTVTSMLTDPDLHPPGLSSVLAIAAGENPFRESVQAKFTRTRDAEDANGDEYEDQ